METSIETSQTGGKPRPTLGPKPRLAPKPFSLQKNNAIRSIYAPKTVTTASKKTVNQYGKPEATSVPRVILTTPAQKPSQHATTPNSEPSSISVPLKERPKSTKETTESPPRQDTLDSCVAPGKSDPALQTTPPVETPKSEPAKKEAVIQTNHKAPADIVTNAEQKEDQKQEDKSSFIQQPEESESPSTDNPAFQRGGNRKRLSTKLTSKFESGGVPPLFQPTVTVSTTNTKDNANKPPSSPPKHSQTTPEPSNRDSNEEEPMEYSGGGSIKRRISMLFDSSLRPEAMTKKEEPEMIPSTGGVKERIKNWTKETSSATSMAQVAPRTRSSSFEATSPIAEKTPKLSPVEPPANWMLSTPAVAPSSKISSVKQSAEIPMETSKDADEKPQEKATNIKGEHEQNKTTEVAVPQRSCSPSKLPAPTDEGDSAPSETPPHTPKRNKAKRRTVRFGIVESDDGGPPLILGSPSDSSSEEEEAPEDKDKKNTPISVPLYRRVGQNKGDETQKQEKEHFELDKRLKAAEIEQAKLKLEEERKKREEEEEREKEMARQREELRLREEEKQRVEERERETELLLQRQREEERERARQKEKQLKKDQEEREKERLKEEERQRLREVEEQPSHEHNVQILERNLRDSPSQKEERWEKEFVNMTERMKGEDKESMREKQLELMWQDREKARQIDERGRQEEREKEGERQRKEAEDRERERQIRVEKEEKMRAIQRQEEEERKRIELEIKMQHEKEEMERIWQIERQKEDEERRRQMEKERAEQLERKQAKELEEKLRMKEERDKQVRLTEERAMEESNLMSFDSEHLSQMSEKSQPPLTNNYEPQENLVEVVYDDFSVKKPNMEVEFDDFSVKPKRRGTRAKVENHPVQSWRAEPVDKEELEVLVSVDVRPQQSRAPEPVSHPDRSEPTPTTVTPMEEEEQEEEEQPEEEEHNYIEDEEEEEESTAESEVETQEDEDMQEAQVNSYCINGEDKDTDALINREPDQQNGVCERASETDSPKATPVSEVSSEDLDRSDFHKEPELAPFPESSTPLLDTSAQKSKVDLARRRSRNRPSRSLRLAQTRSTNWRLHDATDKKKEDTDSEEELPKPKVVCSSPTSQRAPIVSVRSPAALIAQLKRRTAGGGNSTEDDKEGEEESQHQDVAPSPSQLPRSPRPVAHLAGAALVLPPLGGTDGGATSSPAWLKELKSKKRLSQYDSEA